MGGGSRDLRGRLILRCAGMMWRRRHEEFHGEFAMLRAVDSRAALQFAIGALFGAVRERIEQSLFYFGPVTTPWNDARSLNLNVKPGSLTALLGAETAGTSSLVSLLDTGRADQIRLGSVGICPSSQAIEGLAVVHHDAELIDGLTVAENMALGRVQGWLVRHTDEQRRATQALEHIGADLDVDRLASSLDPVERLQVLLARDVVLTGAPVVALNEPFFGLSDESAAKAFDTLHLLQESGVGVLFISRQVDRIFKVADRVAVLRDGALVYDGPTQQTTPDEVVRQISGIDLPRSPTLAAT